jgi:hypothetical protein
MKISKFKKNYKNTKKSKNNKKGGNSSQQCIYDEKSGTMKGVCPGVIYFDEIKDSIVIDPDAVYMIFGHGCDLKGELIEIPPKCKFITRVACGLTSSDLGDYDKRGVLGEFFFDDFYQNKLETPINIETLGKYERLLQFSSNLYEQYTEMGHYTRKHPSNDLVYTQNWHIHNHGEHFVNSKNSCFYDLGVPAGLRKLGIATPQIPDFSIAIEKYTWRSYALLHFEGSIFPTCQQVSIILNANFTKSELDGYNYYTIKLQQIIKDTFSIDYGTIVKHLVGTFINGACRPICHGPKTIEDIYGDLDRFVKTSRTLSQRDNSKTIYEVPKEFVKSEDYYLTPELKSKLEKIKNDE